MNKKILLAGFLFMFSLGCIANWLFSRIDWTQPQAIATENKTELKPSRKMLEEKYKRCIGNRTFDASNLPDEMMEQFLKKDKCIS